MPRPSVSFSETLGFTSPNYRIINSACQAGVVQSTGSGYRINAYASKQISAGISTKPWVPYHFVPPTRWSVRDEMMLFPYVYGITHYVGDSSCSGVTVPATFDYYDTVYPSSPVTLPSYTYSSVLEGRCVNQLLTAIKNDGGASLGLALLERKETEDLLVGVIEKIASAVETAKRFKREGFKRVLRAYKHRDEFARRGGTLTRREKALSKIPNFWLEMQYGWVPLMSDVHQALQAVDYYQTNGLYHFSKRRRVKDVTDTVNGTLNASTEGYKFLWSAPVIQSCIYRVDYQVDTSALPILSSLGLANPVDLLWERLPFSFVVDWFLPVGNWFNTFDATLGKHFIAGSRTRTWSYQSDVNTTNVFGRSMKVVEGGRTRSFSMDRDVLHSFPSPAAPRFKNPCSPTHVANALSLLVTAFTKGIPRGLTR